MRIDSGPGDFSSHASTSAVQGHHLSLGVACMSKVNSHNDLIRWLHHHRMHIGVEHFFLRLENMPVAAQDILLADEWTFSVHVTFAEGPHARDCGGMQTTRQDEHVQQSIVHARQLGCTHLLHLDDDELLYLPSGLPPLHALMLHASPDAVAELHIRNLEALSPGTSCERPFSDVVCFRHRPREYSGYGALQGSTGKSMGVLRHGGLIPLGPHHFGTCEPPGLAVGRAGLVMGRARRAAIGHAETLVVPPAIAVILHFHCASLSRWQAKYSDHIITLRDLGQWQWQQAADAFVASAGSGMDMTSSEHAMPHDFHGQSCVAASAMVSAYESGVFSAMTAAAAAGRRVWERWKLQPPEVTALVATLGADEAHRVLSNGITLIRPPYHGSIEHAEPPRVAATLAESMSAMEIQ